MKTFKEVLTPYLSDSENLTDKDLQLELTLNPDLWRITEAASEYVDQFKPKWISANDSVPEVDESDEWKNKQRHSKTVPVIERGELNLGWYNHQLEDWQVNGRIGNIQVTEWFDLPLPTKP